MFNLLFPRGVDVLKYQINDGNLHAFNYWRRINEKTGNLVGTDVVNFFNQHLN